MTTVETTEAAGPDTRVGASSQTLRGQLTDPTLVADEKATDPGVWDG